MRFLHVRDNQTRAKAEKGVPNDVKQDTGLSRNQDLALEVAARAAVQYTGASAAAIALIKNKMLVCRARVGGIAPDLGMRLDVNSGITGACVRSRTVMHCVDTESDPRVDSLVCRTLGIRSVLVVPVLSKGNVVGVVEVLSAKAHAFKADHILWLVRLADFICQMSFSPAAEGARAHPSLLPATETVVPSGPAGKTEPTMDRHSSLADERTTVPGDTSLAAFLSVLPKSSQSSTWDEMSEALTSRMKVTGKG